MKHRTIDVEHYTEGIGLPRVTPYNNRKRACKHCGTRLSIYNDNRYCFAHMLYGADDKRVYGYKQGWVTRKQRGEVQI